MAVEKDGEIGILFNKDQVVEREVSSDVFINASAPTPDFMRFSNENCVGRWRQSNWSKRLDVGQIGSFPPEHLTSGLHRAALMM